MFWETADRPHREVAGEYARFRFAVFFTANIPNLNTRAAYAQAVSQFCAWCEERRLELARLNPVVIAAYVEDLGKRLAPPSVKQHLAAIRMLFDWFVVGQVMPINPASSVRGPQARGEKRGKRSSFLRETRGS